jgi:lipoprotein signal peptidase
MVDHLTYHGKLKISFAIAAAVCLVDFGLKIWAQNNLAPYNDHFFTRSGMYSPFLAYVTNVNFTPGSPFNPLIIVGVIALFAATFVVAYRSQGFLPILACGLMWAIILDNGLERALTGVGIDYLGFILPFNFTVICIVNLADLAGIAGMLILFLCALRPSRFGDVYL